MKTYIFAFLLVFLSGCAGAKPFATVSIGHQIDKNSDWYVRTQRDWQCDKNVEFNGAVGVEFPGDWQLAYHHQSWYFCGGPLNSDSELYKDDIRLTKKFGGIK